MELDKAYKNLLHKKFSRKLKINGEYKDNKLVEVIKFLEKDKKTNLLASKLKKL